MAISFKVYPRRDYVKKDGTTALYLWVRLNRKLKKYPLPHYIDPKKWDWKSNQMKGSTPYIMSLNNYIRNELDRANNIAIKIMNSGKEMSFGLFETSYLKNDKEDYYTFVENFITKNKGRLTDSYLYQLRTEISKLKKFRETLHFQEIDHSFIADYEYYMRNVLQNSTNTVHKTLKRLKSMINEAIAQDETLFSRNPFTSYKLKTEPTTRMFLTKEELDKLFEMRNDFTGKVKNVVQYFLFSCYTGLRYQDIKDLKFRNVEKDRIVVKMHKTHDTVTIPLIERSQQLIPERQNPEDTVFPVISNQKTNDYLKLAIEKAEINKNITFHCARHTFATVALNSGIPLEVVQKLLGHSMIRTTQIYSKVLTETLFEQMGKMG